MGRRASVGSVLSFISPLGGCILYVIWQSDIDRCIFFNLSEVLGIAEVKVMTEWAAVGDYFGFFFFLRVGLECVKGIFSNLKS